MFRGLHPDRLQSRQPVWFVADGFVTLMFVWITVESLRSSAYVDEYGPIEGFGWVLAISPTLPLLFRRAAPATSLAVATVLYMAASGFQGDSNAPLAIPFYAYSVGLTRPVPVSGWMVGAATAAMLTSLFYGPGEPTVLLVPITVMLFGIGWLVALSIRRNQTRASDFADEAHMLRAESSQVAHRAAADERARIARELHDAVGHSVNVIVMQAGAARLAAHDERTAETLREIERVGRSALVDLDHMLGLLHNEEGDPAPLEPVHSTADIVRLVDDMRAAGADIHFHNQCGDQPDDRLERQVGAAAYRIVQESLTNSIKHAGDARIDVTLSCTPNDFSITVVDNGLGAAAPISLDGGRGIAGMTERASVLGGHLTAHPLDEGGFRVDARIPRAAQTAKPANPVTS